MIWIGLANFIVTGNEVSHRKIWQIWIQKYSNNSFWPQSTDWIFILLTEKGSLFLLAWCFAAVQFSMLPSAAFSGVLLTEEVEWVLWIRVSAGSHPCGTVSLARIDSLVFLFIAKIYTKEKEASRCSAYNTQRIVFELLLFKHSATAVDIFREQAEAEIWSSCTNEQKVSSDTSLFITPLLFLMIRHQNALIFRKGSSWLTPCCCV